jgi:hypothetical protein
MLLNTFWSRSRSSWRALVIQVSLGLGFATSAATQYTPDPPGGYGQEGGGRPGCSGGGPHMEKRGGGGDMPSPDKIEGPASPAIMRDTVGLSDEQLNLYATRYAKHMAATQPVRDSLRASMQEIRAAFESGDRSAVRERRSELERQWKDLSKRDKEFEKALEDLLSKEQEKRYEKWKEAREKAARERMEHFKR